MRDRRERQNYPAQTPAAAADEYLPIRFPPVDRARSRSNSRCVRAIAVPRAGSASGLGSRLGRPIPTRAWSAESSTHHPEGSPPASLVKEVNHDFGEEAQTLAEFLLQVLIPWSFKRPVDEHRPSDQVLAGYESPVPAVITDIAVVAHGEIAVRGDHDVIALNVLLQRSFPFRKQVVEIRGSNCREIVAVGVKEDRAAVNDIRFVEFFPVAEHHPIAQVNVVPGNADDALDHVQTLLRGRQKHHDVLAANI